MGDTATLVLTFARPMYLPFVLKTLTTMISDGILSMASLHPSFWVRRLLFMLWAKRRKVWMLELVAADTWKV